MVANTVGCGAAIVRPSQQWLAVVLKDAMLRYLGVKKRGKSGGVVVKVCHSGSDW
jgi:hypothetical protein|tara:strand:+ start:325 stop:489 length:165 start_codon:yes stop_codon:yes gene_type:complete